jgi:hypothetical protein
MTARATTTVAQQPAPASRAVRRRVALVSWALISMALLALGLNLLRWDAAASGRSLVRYVEAPTARPFEATDTGTKESTHQARKRWRVGETVPPVGVAGRGCPVTLRANQLAVPDLCISAPLVPTSRTAQGALRIPASATEVGHWDGGAALSATSGTTLLAGHVTYGAEGRGSLFDLARVGAGQTLYTVDGEGNVHAWEVLELEQVTKQRLPETVFAGRSGPRRLVVVTCGGPVIHVPGYGATHRDNVVVTARPQ